MKDEFDSLMSDLTCWIKAFVLDLDSKLGLWGMSSNVVIGPHGRHI